MILQIIPKGGIGHSAPLVLEATQVLVLDGKGTILAVAADHGPVRGYCIGHAQDADFNRTLATLGIHRFTICDTLHLPKAPTGGARIIAGQDPTE